MITFQYRLFASKSQISNFLKQLEVHKILYNQCLEQKIESYKLTGKSPSCFDLQKSNIPQFKGESNYSSLQQTVRRLDKSYQAFFKQNKGFPRFKQRLRTIEYSKIGDGCQFKDNIFYFQYLGKVKANIHRPIPNDYKIKTISLTFKHGELFANVICEKIFANYSEKTRPIGIDFGISTSITTSDGDKFITPKFTKSQAKTLARLQRKKEKSKNKRKIKKAIAKVYTKTENRRKDFNHKLSRKIVNSYDIICLEDIKSSSIMTKIANINSRILDVGLCQLKTFIKYKAENAGKVIVLVNPAYTTQTCSNCMDVTPKELNEREHKCRCGLILCRDVNAAKNILRLGLESFQDNS